MGGVWQDQAGDSPNFSAGAAPRGIRRAAWTNGDRENRSHALNSNFGIGRQDLIQDYQRTIEFLYGLRLFGTKLGLENTFRLAELCGNPQQRLRFIHVAGTNGKGSTCAMLESICRQAGLKTGLFTSPHLISFTERIQVNRVCISEEDVVKLTEEIIESLGGRDIEKWEVRPTFFEFVTIMALLFFERARCEIVIWETGLGGRLDATNIVTPLISVITNIQYDHEQWLGHTLAEIAAEKAGIIKPRIPVVTGTESEEALMVIRERAQAASAPLTVVTEPLERIDLPLIGAHQKKNAAVALAAIQQVERELPITEDAVKKGLSCTWWPGRLQIVNLGNGRLLLDGAHNPDGAAALARTLRADFANEEKTLVLGLFKDKAWQAMVDMLAPIFRKMVLAPVHSDRTADPAEVLKYCRQSHPNVEVIEAGTLREAIQRTLGEGRLAVVTGSLHFVGETMEVLGFAPHQKSERQLNEWDAGRGRNG